MINYRSHAGDLLRLLITSQPKPRGGPFLPGGLFTGPCAHVGVRQTRANEAPLQPLEGGQKHRRCLFSCLLSIGAIMRRVFVLRTISMVFQSSLLTVLEASTLVKGERESVCYLGVTLASTLHVRWRLHHRIQGSEPLHSTCSSRRGTFSSPVQITEEVQPLGCVWAPLEAGALLLSSAHAAGGGDTDRRCCRPLPRRAIELLMCRRHVSSRYTGPAQLLGPLRLLAPSSIAG